MEYHVLREWFLETAGLPTSFDFAMYLRKCLSREAVDKVEVKIKTWIGLLVYGTLWVLPLEMLAISGIYVNPHYVFAAVGWSQPLLGVLGLYISRRKMLNLLEALGYTTDLHLEKEIERIASSELTSHDIAGRPQSKVLKSFARKRESHIQEVARLAEYRRHTAIDQLLLAVSCVYIALFCTWFAQNLSQVATGAGLQFLWVLFIMTPVLIEVLFIQPILFTMGTHFAALVFPDHFTDQLGEVIERHGETREQLNIILDVFREELALDGVVHTSQDLASVFAQFDVQKRGWVTSEDFHALLQQKHLYSFLGTNGEKAVDRLMRIFDPMRQGHFDYEVFAQQLFRHTGVRHVASQEEEVEMEVPEDLRISTSWLDGRLDGGRTRSGTLEGRLRGASLGGKFTPEFGLDLGALTPRRETRSGSWFRASQLVGVVPEPLSSESQRRSDVHFGSDTPVHTPAHDVDAGVRSDAEAGQSAASPAPPERCSSDTPPL
eukprot:TRINITY_DN8257_c0_g1_i1.p1 TRINITY_DN8257_c0_g1~~TRINITY_DN8257_c0_g1_i1.p1  ORF type:complete len:491 (-),score=90.71 TRINITY_DN8257_c0_g1_i1:224-1696(-)